MLYVVAKLASIFSLVGLAYTGVLAAFTLPKVRAHRGGDGGGGVGGCGWVGGA